MNLEFDHNLWHKANQLCRGDKVHNLRIAMACYFSNFKRAEKQPSNPDKLQRVSAWHGILNDIVNSP